MLRPGPRRRVLAAALLLVSLLLLAVAPGAHEGHACRLDKSCLACRWAADSAAETAAPLALPKPADAVSRVASPAPARLVEGAPGAASSRGPPPA